MMVERISRAGESSSKAKRSSTSSPSRKKSTDKARYHQADDSAPLPYPPSPLTGKDKRQSQALNESGKISTARRNPSENLAPSGHRSISRNRRAPDRQTFTGSARNSRSVTPDEIVGTDRSMQRCRRSSRSPEEAGRGSSHAGSNNRKPGAAANHGSRNGIPTSTSSPPSSPTPFDRERASRSSNKQRASAVHPPGPLPPPSPRSSSPRGKSKTSGRSAPSPEPQKSTSRHRPSDEARDRRKSVDMDASRSPVARSPGSHRRRGRVTVAGPPLSRPNCETDESRPIDDHGERDLPQHPASPTQEKAVLLAMTLPPTSPATSDDLVDAVAQEAPDYREFYSSPRRRSSSDAVPPSTPRITNAQTRPVLRVASGESAGARGGGGTAPERSQPFPRGDRDAAPTHIDPIHRIEHPRSPSREPLTALPQQRPSSPLSSRVASTRSRLQGVMGTIHWIIQIDTPGGHAEDRLRLVAGIELRGGDDDDNDNGYDYNQGHAKAPGQRTTVARGPVPMPSKLSLSAQRRSRCLDEGIHFVDPEDDSSLDTDKLHESVLRFMKRLESNFRPMTENPDDSIVDYEHRSRQSSLAGASITVPHASSTSTPQSSLLPSTHSSRHPSSHQAAPSDQKPVPPQRLVSQSNMWQSSRVAEPQLQPPPPQPVWEITTTHIPSGSGTSSSSSKLLTQQKEPRQPQHTQTRHLVHAPSNRFVPRVANNDDATMGGNDSTTPITRENSLDSRTFADTVGDDTIYDSCDMPDMWQIEAFEKSHTWGQVDDFSISDAGEAVDDDYTDDEETLVNPFSSGCKSVDTNVIVDDEEEDDDESEYLRAASSGLVGATNYGYVGTPAPVLAGQSSAFRLGKRDGRADEASIDPSKCFLPRGSGASTLTNASDSLADIQDSFACDSGVADFQNSQSTHKRKNTSDLSIDSSVNLNQNSHARGLRSLPEDRVLSEEGNNEAAYAAPTAMRRTIGILGGGASSGVKRSSSVRAPPQPILASRNDTSRLSATQHPQARKTMSSRHRFETTQSTAADASRYSNVSVPILASQFADAFLGPAATAKHAGQTTCSENDVDTLEHQSDTPILTPQKSVNSLSTGSDSSASRRSFGIPGLRARSQDDANPFVQFNLTAADGVKVIRNTDDVDSGRTKHFNSSHRVSAMADPQLYAKSDHDRSIDVFDASNAMPPLVDAAEQPRRKSPSRAISLLGNRRAGKKPAPATSAPDTQPFKTPIVSNRRFLRREKSSEGLVSKSSHHDIVKRFFTMANSSFGSLGPPAEFLDEDDGDFLY